MTDQSSSVAVGIRLKTWRIECTGLNRLDSARSPSPASCAASSAPSRSRSSRAQLALDRVVGQGRVLGEHPVQLGQRLPGQRRLGLQPGRAGVGQPVVAGAGAQRGGDDRVEVADGVDVAVGDLAGGGWAGQLGGGGHRIRSSRADISGRSGSSGPARSIAYISAPSTMP